MGSVATDHVYRSRFYIRAQDCLCTRDGVTMQWVDWLDDVAERHAGSLLM
jgi:hypothetical protein